MTTDKTTQRTPYDEDLERYETLRANAKDSFERATYDTMAQHVQLLRRTYRRALSDLNVTGSAEDYVALPRADFEALVQAAERLTTGEAPTVADGLNELRDALAAVRALRGEAS